MLIHLKHRLHFYLNYFHSSVNLYLLSQQPFIPNDFLQCNSCKANQSLDNYLWNANMYSALHQRPDGH